MYEANKRRQTAEQAKLAAAQRYQKLKAWNDYMVEHLGLRIEKSKSEEKLEIHVFQGSFLVYHQSSEKVDDKSKTVMHRYLKDFLERYLAAIKDFHDFMPDRRFRPPLY